MTVANVDDPRLDRRHFAALAGALGLGALWPGWAGAAPSTRRSLRELLAASDCCILGIPLSAESRWETVARRSRIVTYSTVGVDQPLDDQTQPGDELLVRTLGGEVGGIGQWVAQEARIALHRPSLLFLQALAAPDPGALRGAYAVTGMAEGHYRLRAATDAPARLHVDRPDAGGGSELDGLTLEQARARIARELLDAR